MSKKDLVLGIDIGSHAVKVCQLKYAGNIPRILALGSVLLPDGAIVDGNLEQPEAVSVALSRLLKNLKIRNKKIGFSISGYSVIVKKVNLPAMSAADLESYIAAEAEQYIPFDIDDVYLDYQDLHTENQYDGGSRTDVMLVAAKKEVVDGYLQMFSGLKLKPMVVDVDGFAFENSYEFVHDSGENIALVNIGAAKMSISISIGGIFSVAREVMFGSSLLTEELSEVLDVDFAVAEDIKIGKEQQPAKTPVIGEAFLNICSRWVLEIKKVLDLHHSNNPEQKLTRIVLAGGGAKVAGFATFLADETGLPVKVFNPFIGFDFDRKKVDPAYLKIAGPEMAIATGIALRRAVI